MKISLALILALFGLPLLAQSAANPVVEAARAAAAREGHNLVAAAQEMPAEKYSFRPTEPQMSFAHLVAHVAQSNQFLCSKLAGTEAPKPLATDTDPKDKLVSAVNSSFEYCSGVLEKLKDSDLSAPVTLWGGWKTTKAGAVIALTSDWADHYGASAQYLRLNGLLPPTAEKEGKKGK